MLLTKNKLSAITPIGENIIALYVIIIVVPSIIIFLISLSSFWKFPIINTVTPKYNIKSYGEEYVKNKEMVLRAINKYKNLLSLVNIRVKNLIAEKHIITPAAILFNKK